MNYKDLYDCAIKRMKLCSKRVRTNEGWEKLRYFGAGLIELATIDEHITNEEFEKIMNECLATVKYCWTDFQISHNL